VKHRLNLAHICDVSTNECGPLAFISQYLVQEMFGWIEDKDEEGGKKHFFRVRTGLFETQQRAVILNIGHKTMRSSTAFRNSHYCCSHKHAHIALWINYMGTCSDKYLPMLMISRGATSGMRRLRKLPSGTAAFFEAAGDLLCSNLGIKPTSSSPPLPP